jgi:glycogen operon protein
VGDTILMLFNAHYEPIPFTLPETRTGQPWERLFDTTLPAGEPLECGGGQQYDLQGRSMVVLRTEIPQEQMP